jgi:hypothetical protein
VHPQGHEEVLEFLVLLIYPNKPSWMTIQAASAMVDYLINKNKIYWAQVFEEVIQKQITKLNKIPVSFIPAYAVHLYAGHKALSKMELGQYNNLKWRVKSGYQMEVQWKDPWYPKYNDTDWRTRMTEH